MNDTVLFELLLFQLELFPKVLFPAAWRWDELEEEEDEEEDGCSVWGGSAIILNSNCNVDSTSNNKINIK